MRHRDRSATPSRRPPNIPVVPGLPDAMRAYPSPRVTSPPAHCTDFSWGGCVPIPPSSTPMMHHLRAVVEATNTAHFAGETFNFDARACQRAESCCFHKGLQEIYSFYFTKPTATYIAKKVDHTLFKRFGCIKLINAATLGLELRPDCLLSGPI